MEPIQDEEDLVVSTRSDCLSISGLDINREVNSATLHDCEEASLSFSNVFSGEIELDANEQSTLTVQKEVIKTDAAKFILTLKEKYKMTQASLDYNIKAVDKLIFMSSKVVEQLLAEGDQGQYSSPFDDLQTEYQQTKYFKENFSLIVSVHVMCIPFQTLFLVLPCRNH